MPELSLTFGAAVCAPALPALAFALLGLTMFVHRAPAGVLVARLVSWALAGSALATLIVAASFVAHDGTPMTIELGSWFRSGGYGFEAILRVDRLSAPMMLITAILCSLIARFSSTYLEAEPGEARFYLLLSLFATGMFVLVMAGSLDLLIAGWELVGMSSMLLIGFFLESAFPVRNALRTFTIYRACDIGLLVGAVLMHHYAHTGVLQVALGLGPWPTGEPLLQGTAANLVALCLFWAACGKSALFPVGNWLPRAMEGPTPSSAIFYGALSVHAGAYLMLRVYPLLENAYVARAVVLLVGVLTAATGTLTQRVQTDVKSQLAYATSTQVGVIFVEIALGLPRLALLHLVSHALLRTLQLLRAPNVIHDVTTFSGSAAEPPISEARLPSPEGTSRLARWLYQLSFARFHLDAFWDRAVGRPVLGVARLIGRAERRYIAALTRVPAAAGQPATPPLDPGPRKSMP
jgi:NADH-quinone oxidoreductase subunit L